VVVEGAVVVVEGTVVVDGSVVGGTVVDVVGEPAGGPGVFVIVGPATGAVGGSEPGVPVVGEADRKPLAPPRIAGWLVVATPPILPAGSTSGREWPVDTGGGSAVR
jgi:hypothetical protein